VRLRRRWLRINSLCKWLDCSNCLQRNTVTLTLTFPVLFACSVYGQIETILQLINAYFQITFTEWCWVFMDGIWTVTLAMTLPLARAANTLAPSRPTASILGLQTMSSVLGVLSINFIFIVIGLSMLWHQDWFQCRMWDDNDVSNVLVIGKPLEIIPTSHFDPFTCSVSNAAGLCCLS
jgi:hypothetical protein